MSSMPCFKWGDLDHGVMFERVRKRENKMKKEGSRGGSDPGVMFGLI